jgi:hypothetical protein
MRHALVALVALSGIASAFLVYLGATAVDVVVSVYTLVYWATAPFMRPLPRPVNRIHTAIGVALLSAFAYFAALRVLAALRV